MTTVTMKDWKEDNRNVRTKVINVKPPMRAEQMEQIKTLKAKGRGCHEAGATVSRIEPGKITIKIIGECKLCDDALLGIILPKLGKVKSITYRLE